MSPPAPTLIAKGRRPAKVITVVTRAMTGHVTDQMAEHYSFVENAEKRAALVSISRLIGDEFDAKGVSQGVSQHQSLDKEGRKN